MKKELNIFEHIYIPASQKEKKHWLYSPLIACGIAAAMLVLVIAILLVLYIMFLPEAERNELLGNETYDSIDDAEDEWGLGGIAKIDPSDFNGETAYFEVVAKNSGGLAYSVLLRKHDSNVRDSTDNVWLSKIIY